MRLPSQVSVSRLKAPLAAPLLVLLAACGAADEGGFVSANPSDPTGGGGDGSADAGVSEPDPGAEPDDPERAIAEADIIQVQGQTLYALSRHAGLAVIDIARPEQPTLLGRHDEATGVPFEMYLRDGVVYAMFSEWVESSWDEESSSWATRQTSHLEALDVSDPARIERLGWFDLPGAVSDSRIVGDVLYAVSFQSGDCWGCAGGRQTTVTSIAVADPAAIAVVDQLAFADEDPYGYGWRRSVTATAERMYVAGVEWDGSDEGHSTIQVVDISDPAGRLVPGASVQAAGQIQSRWQIDEHAGVLRVISQPGVWWTEAPPRVQTFEIVSSQEFRPLGAVDLVLPRPEALRSVRFDGDRAYAITFERTDPLFAIDLSRPAAPRQVGELEIPGWVHHMVPRGDRLLALGYDPALPGGALNVSLFDVSDLTRPALLDRASFGGDRGEYGEDQDRIHKALTIVDELGLILVPFAGFSYGDGDGCGSYRSGIQLVDFTADSLELRGLAQARGPARRAFMHGGSLLAVSDDEVRAFDIADRDAPRVLGSLQLAAIANRSVVAGDLVARLSADWWSGLSRVEVVPAAAPDREEPLGAVEVAGAPTEDNCGGSSPPGTRLFAHGSHAYLVQRGASGTRIVTVDLRQPASPRIDATLSLPATAGDEGGYGGVVSSGAGIVQIGSTLVLRRLAGDEYDGDVLHDAALEVIDLSDPTAPTRRTLDLPRTLGHTGLHASGSVVAMSHWVPVGGDTSRIRFYLDRIDLSDPGAPAISSVNVPGSLVWFDAARGEVLAMDYRRRRHDQVTAGECHELGWDANFEPDDPARWDGQGTCTTIERSLQLVRIQGDTARVADVHELGATTWIWQVWSGDDRVFARAQMNSDPWEAPWYGGALLAIGGMRDGQLSVRRATDPGLASAHPVAVSGARLVLGAWSPWTLWTLDASDLDELRAARRAILPGGAEHVTVDGDRALVSLGYEGLEVVELGD